MTALLRECVNVWRKRLFNRTDHLNEDAGQNGKGNRHWEDQVVAGHADQSTGNDRASRLTKRRSDVQDPEVLAGFFLVWQDVNV